MSTGYYTGDGRQASHWKADELTGIYIGQMDPTIAYIQIDPITFADTRALEMIGWDLADVPEPATFVLFGAGLAVLAFRRKLVRS
jgi:hypothetical protein